MAIRRLEAGDIAAVVALQASCPEIAQWTARDYERVARGEMAGWAAEYKDGIAGFLVAQPLAGETEILNFAVRADARRCGIGTALLKEALHWSRSLSAKKVFLEVRASNAPALTFYEGHGFRLVGRRTKYYADPTEGALVLSFVLAPDVSAG